MSAPSHSDAGGKSRRSSTYLRMVDYTQPYLPRLFVGILFGIIFAVSTPGLLFVLKLVLKDVFVEEVTWRTMLGIAALLPALALLRGVGYFFSVYFIDWVGNKVVMDLRAEAYAHLQDLSLQYFTTSRTGDLITRISSDAQMLERAVSTIIGDLVRQPLSLLGLLGVLFWLNTSLAFISILVFPICIIPVYLFGRRVRRFARMTQEKLSDLVSILQETIVGVRIVKAFGMEAYERNRFEQQCNILFRKIISVTRARASVEPIVVVLSALGLALVLLYARKMNMTPDDFITFSAAMVAMYGPFKKLGNIHLVIQRSSASGDRLFELIDTPITVFDHKDAKTFDGPVERVTFEHVDFAYESAPILQDVNLDVNAGQCIALVGGSGAGKSTFVGLIPRFFDVTAGAILINGQDIRTLTLQSLRRQFGIVTQETILFNDTVAKNIAYGDTSASREAIEEAARRAYAHEFILQMEEGYETVIGERGVRLSGGQCQRLSIARAILRNPPILILDEATSALDTESERSVQAALDKLMENRTVFAIAHRLSTIAHADRILVLENGRIVEDGTHQELLDQSGQYKRLYDLQFQV